MTTRHTEGGGPELLSHGEGAPRRSPARLWGIAVVCLALGALVGVQVDDTFDDRRAAEEQEAAPPVLSAGVIQENPETGSDLRFAVPMFNGGSTEVAVDAVEAIGWVPRAGSFQAVTIPPDSWMMVPLRVQVDCDAGTTAPVRLTVRSSTAYGEFEQIVPMPSVSRVLTEERSRLCLKPVGSVPTLQELVGSWFVEEAGRSTGTVVRLREDGTFAIDPDVFRFGAELNALGTFTRSGATLRLVAAAGNECRRGDRTAWALTLLENGRLHIRHRPSGEHWCGIEAGDVWVARPIPERAAGPARP